MTSRYYTMTDSTGESGFLPTVTFDGSSGVFTSAHRTNTLNSIGITGFYEADFADAVTTIDSHAFSSDTKVVVATINRVTTINNNAFYNCTALRSITLDCAVDATSKKYLLTSIGSGTFAGCTSLRHLHIPDTVKIIPDYMCNFCTSLEFAVMGYGWNRSGDAYVTDSTIGQNAFGNCPKLTYFVVPETVSSIGNNAFEYDVSLALVTILGTPTVGAAAFSGAMGSGAIYYYNTTNNISSSFPAAASIRAYTEVTFSQTGVLQTSTAVSALTNINSYWKGKILSGVTTIGAETSCVFRPASITAAKYSNMIGMSFPSSLTAISYGSFEAWVTGTTYAPCNVTAFYFPNSVTTFPLFSGDSAAFRLGNDGNRLASSTRQFVFLSGTSTVTFGPRMFQDNCARAYIIPNITNMPNYCFYYSQNAYFFSFFQKNAYTLLTAIGVDTQYVLEGCFKSGVSGYRHYIHIPKQTTHIGADAFRAMAEKLVVTTYHNTVNSAGTTLTTGLVTAGYFNWNSSTATGGRFQGPISPTVHVINNNYDVNGNALTASSSIGTGFNYHVLYSANVKTITSRFAGLVDLKSIAVHHSATQTVVINDAAFQNCSGLNFVYLNNRVKTLGYNAFRNIPLSNTFDLIDAHPLDAIYHAAFFTDNITCNLSQISIPNTVKVLGSFVVASQLGFKTSFTTLSFENGIEFWGDYDNTIGASSVIASFGTLNSSNVRHMAIPHQFCINCEYLRNVSFLNTAVDLSLNPVPAASNGLLDRVNSGAPIPTRYNVQTLSPAIKRISNGAFQSNYRLQSIRVPEGVTTIDVNAFYDTYSITYLYLPDTLTTMGLAAFNYVGAVNQFGYSGLEVSVRIPQAMIDFVVPDTANGATGYFNSNATATRFFTVSFNTSSGKVTNGVLGRFTNQAVNTYIKYHVVTLNGITGILGGSTNNARAFDNFTSLKTLTIADTVTDIGQAALYNCTGLTNVFISPTSNLTFTGGDGGVFYNCTSLTSFFIPNSLRSIKLNEFYGCTSMASITYGNNPGLKYIGNSAFVDVAKTMTNIFIPSSVIFIGNSAFLTTVNTNVNLLNTVTFGAGSRLRSIDYQCFGHNGSNIQRSAQYLRDFVLPNSLRYLGPTSTGNSSALQNTHRITHSANLVLPVSLEVIPWAFLYADSSAVDISNVYFPRSITNSVGPRKHNGYSMNNAPTPVSTGLMGAEFNASKAGTLIYLPSELSTYTSTVNGATTFAFPNFSGTNRARSYYRTVAYTTNPLITLSLGGTVANTTNSATSGQPMMGMPNNNSDQFGLNNIQR